MVFFVFVFFVNTFFFKALCYCRHAINLKKYLKHILSKQTAFNISGYMSNAAAVASHSIYDIFKKDDTLLFSEKKYIIVPDTKPLELQQ